MVGRSVCVLASASALSCAQPQVCTTYEIQVNADGTFTYAGGPPDLEVYDCDVVRWVGLGRDDSIVRIDGVTAASNPDEICFTTAVDTTSYVYPHASRVDPSLDNDLNGPIRRGLSGIWVLGPEGHKTSYLELPSVPAEELYCSLHPCVPPLDWATIECADFTHAAGNYGYLYEEGEFHDSKSDPARFVPGEAVDGSGVIHKLCEATTFTCASPPCAQADYVKIDFVAWDPDTIPPGTTLNGVLESTYANPDVTGVVLRFNWSDLQYDDPADDGDPLLASTIKLNWQHLDRELEKAIANGKYVTLDIRAGMFGTPTWIFTDYLDPASAHHAPWCTAAGCGFVSAPADAGMVEAIEFLDHYDEDPSGNGCGDVIRIGKPRDPAYVALYTQFLAELADHVASDSRWFQAVAHVKVSGANLRTSEAELPHHCDDQYLATAEHQTDPKDAIYRGADRVLDVFKTRVGMNRVTRECVCNPQLWWADGYAPQQLYDYYANVESQIQSSFFGRKSMGYQIIQDGFPRADAAGSFLGDHMYHETLVASSVDGALVNSCHDSMNVCDVPPETPGSFVEDRVTFASVDYCSIDQATLDDVNFFHCWLGLLPLVPEPGYTHVSAYDTRSPTADGNPDKRYPGPFEQTETILGEARDGRFMAPTLPSPAVPLSEGKLFVPQHSGLQPLPQERVALGYESVVECYGLPDPCECDQHVAAGPPPVLPANIGDVGATIAQYPIASGTTISELQDVPGCPNRWATEQGVTELVAGVPTQLTGFQTTNAVRNLDEMESALFNLVYNTNAVFIELYEDVVWRASIEKGSGPGSLPLSNRVAGTACEYTPGALSLCYSKSLSQWSEELHLRRAQAAAAIDPVTYPALADPFPTEYSVEISNTTGTRQALFYINPTHCDPSLVDLTGVAAQNAVARIVVRP